MDRVPHNRVRRPPRFRQLFSLRTSKMTPNPKRPPIPSPRQASIRREMIDRLASGPLSAREISGLIGIPEKEVCRHLEHIRHSLQAEGRALRVTPAVCKTCGFRFSKRERLGKPGKCPICRGEAIEAPKFAVG
jgi:predicted Zn-ribbon and HTH transcriptional regulator